MQMTSSLNLETFARAVAELRPELHRYCARMLGSVIDGEDVVQDTLARAYLALSELQEEPRLRAWLFQIAHNRALDILRGADRRKRDNNEEAFDIWDEAPAADEELAKHQALTLAVSRFLELPPVQRSCVILKDLLDHSLEEIAELLALSVPAVKAALHRGRVRLRELSLESQADADVPPVSSPVVARYVALFNARDWDGIRAMLSSDVRLELVSRAHASGKKDVGFYFTNYSRLTGWRVQRAWLDAREVMAVFRDASAAEPSYFVEVRTSAGEIVSIHDYRYVPYIARDARALLV
jgi:RNA polymerase sigma-70 factor (ECF subfamily)